MDFVAVINDGIKQAMISKDSIRLETLRSVRAGIIEFEKSGTDKALGEEEFLRIVNAGVKKRKDSIAQYEQYGRTELADKEKQELAILMEFMPKQLSEEEVEAELRAIVVEVGATGAGDFGKVMGVAMKNLKGKADGTIIQTLVKKILA